MATLATERLQTRPLVWLPRPVTVQGRTPEPSSRAGISQPGDAVQNEQKLSKLGSAALVLAAVGPTFGRRTRRRKIRSALGRIIVRSVATDKVPKMSALTLQLIASEIIAEAKKRMEEMPTSWASSVDEEGSLRRHAMTLGYIKTCYGDALEAIPDTLSHAHHKSLKKALTGLSEGCDGSAEYLKTVLGEAEDSLFTVPKYYFSELRSRRRCQLPLAPQTYKEREVLSFLAVEAVSNMRNIKRFGMIADVAEKRGDAKFPDAWPELQKKAEGNALQIVKCMVEVYGEQRAKAEIEGCVTDEGQVVLEVYDLKSPSSAGGSPMFADDDADDDDDFCLIQKPVFVVSDCTGASAKRTVQCALGQFGHCFDRSHTLDITLFRFCTEVQMIEPVVEQAKDREALVVFTLVDPRVNAAMVEACNEYGVEYLDLWSPLLNKLEGYFHTDRLGIPGQQTENYMQLIECIEYTRSLDDGVDPKRWAEADLIIVGPSRSGKTPLSYFMAQRGFKVANYPLVPDEDPPEELWDFHQDRVFALTIKPAKLVSIRTTRMKTLKMGSKSNYASSENVRSEIDWCGKLYRSNPKWRVIDTTDSGIEEISGRILNHLQDSGVQPRYVNDNPSAI